MCPDREFRRPAEPKRNPPRETILVVDDDPWVLALARDILRVEGYHVLEAADGETAQRIAQTHP